MEKSGRHIEGKVQIIITLKNNSKTSIYYVLKRPRNIDYDPGGHRPAVVSDHRTADGLLIGLAQQLIA